jgi:hypothetical protein
MEYFGTGDIILRGRGTELPGSNPERNFGNMEIYRGGRSDCPQLIDRVPHTLVPE